MIGPLIGSVTGPVLMIMAAVPPGDADPASGKGPEWGKAAPVGLLIWLLLGAALFLLIKSMNRNLRKVPASFDGDDAPGSRPQVIFDDDADDDDRYGDDDLDGDDVVNLDGADGDDGWADGIAEPGGPDLAGVEPRRGRDPGRD